MIPDNSKKKLEQLRQEAALRAQLQQQYDKEMSGKYTRDMPTFSDWLGQRPKMTKGGKVPKTLYHGTGSDIREFRPNTFFSDDPKIAGMYAKSQHRAIEGSGPNIMPVHANLKNPFFFDEADARRKGSSFGKMIAPNASTKDRMSRQ